MGPSEFEADDDLEKDYCKFRFAEGVVTDVWEISRGRTDSEEKDCSSVGLASEFQVL